MTAKRDPSSVAELADARVALRAAYDALVTPPSNEQVSQASAQEEAARHVRSAQRSIRRARSLLE